MKRVKGHDPNGGLRQTPNGGGYKPEHMEVASSCYTSFDRDGDSAASTESGAYSAAEILKRGALQSFLLFEGSLLGG